METTCDGCGRTFAATRSDARYCSGKCRTDAYRDRKLGDRPKPKRAPLPEQFRRAENDLVKAMHRLEQIARDDRYSRAVASGSIEPLRLQHIAERIQGIAIPVVTPEPGRDG